MSAKHAVLGLVIERPGYGYDLARRLRERFGSSGFAPTGVYSALDQLSAEGLVRSAGSLAGNRAERVPERAAPRTIYEATEEGRDQFDRWMLSTSSLANVRDELNMKLTLSRPRDLPGLIELACSQEEQCLARIEALKRLDVPAESVQGRSDGGLDWTQVSGLLVRDAEVRQLQARVEWLQRVGVIMARLAGQQRPRLSDKSAAALAEGEARVAQRDQAGNDRDATRARVA